MKYRANFYDKYSDETRSLTVEADDEDSAEDKACEKANSLNWPSGFRLADVEELE